MDNVILAYHRVLPQELIKERGVICVTTKNFEKQMRYFFNKGWSSLTLKEYYFDYIQKGKKPYKKVIVTFDDGYRDNYHYAFPVLKKFNFNATIFLTAGYLETNKAMYFGIGSIPFDEADIDFILTNDQIKEMSEYGIEFGSHTLNHRQLSIISEGEIIYELKKSKEILEQYLAHEVISICYPYGNLNEEVVKLAESENYKIGVVTPSKTNIPKSNLTLRRTGVYLNDNSLKLKIKTTPLFYSLRESGIWEIIKKFK